MFEEKIDKNFADDAFKLLFTYFCFINFAY